MSLIPCPECKGEISDQAAVCPHCGYPVAKPVAEYMCPDVFPPDLSTGKPVRLKDASLKVYYDRKNNSVIIPNVPPKGKMRLVLCEKGFRLSVFGVPLLDLHYSQLARIEERITCQAAPVSAKSMIGRAVAGGMIFGQIGAAIGALSAIETGYDNVLVICFWNTSSREHEVLVLMSREDPAAFMECAREYSIKSGW